MRMLSQCFPGVKGKHSPTLVSSLKSFDREAMRKSEVVARTLVKEARSYMVFFVTKRGEGLRILWPDLVSEFISGALVIAMAPGVKPARTAEERRVLTGALS